MIIVKRREYNGEIKQLEVRKQKVLDALLWLKKYNILYDQIEIDYEYIDNLLEEDRV